MKTAEIERLLDIMSERTYGRKRSECIASGICVTCGGEAKEFRDALGKKEFLISGMCDKCQDETFCIEEEPEE